MIENIPKGSSWGKAPEAPVAKFTARFAAIYRWINRRLLLVTYVLVLVVAAELAYLLLGVTYQVPYVSDGSAYSCQLNVQRAS